MHNVFWVLLVYMAVYVNFELLVCTAVFWVLLICMAVYVNFELLAYFRVVSFHGILNCLATPIFRLFNIAP